MIFYVCQVYNSVGVLAASWATAQTVDYDNVIADISEIKIGLADGVVVPVSNVEMKVLRTASTDAALSSLATAFSLKYKISASIDGTLYPIGTFYHASELPVSDAQTYTLFLQDAISRIGSTDIAPTLAEICAASNATDNPLYGAVSDLVFIKGLELTPTRIGFGDDQWNLNEPVWRKRRTDWGPVVPPTSIQTNDWVHFISHCRIDDGSGNYASTPLEVFTADGGLSIPAQLTLGIVGTGDVWYSSSVPVVKGTRTWYVQILSVRSTAVWGWLYGVLLTQGQPNPLQSAVPNSDGTVGQVTLAEVQAKYTATGESDVWGESSVILGVLTALPLTARWNRISESGIVSGDADGATCIYNLLPLCDTPFDVDFDSYLRTQAVARKIAGPAEGTARAAILQIAAASGINVCASRDGALQFVAPTNDTPIPLDRFDDVRFFWRDTGGRGAAFCGVRIINHKKTPTTSEPDGGTTLLTSSAMYIAGIRNALFEIDCTLIPLAMQQNAASILSYIGAAPNGNQLVSLKIPLRDAKTLKVGDNIQFQWLPYIGASPSTIIASVESMVFSPDGSVEVFGAFNALDYAPYILPGGRLQSIMPALQFALTGKTRDPNFNDGTTYWTYSGLFWKTAGTPLMTNCGSVAVWIRYNASENRIIYAPGSLSWDAVNGVTITRGPDTLEAATTELRNLNNYDILASQLNAHTFATGIGAPSSLATSKSFATIQNAPICNAVGIPPLDLAAMVWTWTAGFGNSLEAATAFTGFFSGTGWCAIVDGVGFEIGAVTANLFGSGKVVISFTTNPTWRTSGTSITGIQFARITPSGVLDTGALTAADGTGAPTGPRVLG